MTLPTVNWNYPTAVKVGAGRIRELPQWCESLGMRRPLLITDPGLASLPLIAGMLEHCRSAGLECGLFHDIKGNPTGKNVDDGVAAFKAGGHDGVIAFGGGSALDAAKAVALMAGQGVRCGTSRILATTICASTWPAWRPWWRCRPQPEPVRKSAGLR